MNIIKSVGWLATNGMWIAFVGALVVCAAAFFIQRSFKLFSAANPWVGAIGLVSGVIAFSLGVIKILAFVSYVLTAHDKIEDLNAKIIAKDAKILEMQQAEQRKNDQMMAVDTTDKAAEIKYVPRYKEIEKLRVVPDLSVANRVMLDMTQNFYGDKNDAPAK